jgi:hypothetical protein
MKLIIVQSINDFELLKKFLNKSTDLLVFSRKVMVALDQKNIKYKAIENIYPVGQFIKEARVFRKKAEKLLLELDKICKNYIHFPFAYSGNEPFFLAWFDDIVYLEKLIENIKRKYKKIYLFSDNQPDQVLESHLNFSSFNSRNVNGTISFSREKSKERFIQLIYGSLNISFIKDKKSLKNNIPINYYLKSFFDKVQFRYERRINLINLNKDREESLKNKKVYIIQDDYELYPLRKYLPKFNYSNPTTQLRKEIQDENPRDVSNIIINKILKNFINNNFFFLKQYLHLFMNSYHLEIVGRINSFKEKFEKQVIKDKPILIFSSSGTRDIFDTITCYVANKMKIPVITFQHAGTTSFYYCPTLKSHEYNMRISKTLIAQSKKDIKKLKNKKTKAICMGSVQEYEYTQILKNKKPNKYILFCTGPDSETKFRHLFDNFSINKKHKRSYEIMSAAEDASLPISIKLHPAGEKNSFGDYQKIIENNLFKKADLIYGSPLEMISRNYKLIIIDFLSSAMVKHLICLKVPIIVYTAYFDKIRVNKVALNDFYKRFYIAKNKSELNYLLSRYRVGKLPSKWNKKIIDNFIYPFYKGNPGENISKYIINLLIHEK